MSQHDYDIANQAFPATRTDFNNVLLAIASSNSGASLPAVTFGGMVALNTTDSLVYMRNAANTAWIVLGKLEAGNTFTPYLGGAAIVSLPAMTGKTLNLPRVNAGETAIEFRTPAQTIADIGGAALAVANTFTESQTFKSDDAGATVGPNLNLYRNSATPAVDDLIGSIRFQGEDSAGNTEDYAAIVGRIFDPTSTSEDGVIEFYTAIAGTLAARWRLWGGLWADGLSEMGQGTLNATGLYVNGVSVKAEAVATLPAPVNLRGNASANDGTALFTADTVYLADSSNNVYRTALNTKVCAAGGLGLVPGTPDDNVTVVAPADVDIYAIGRAAPLGVTPVTVDNTTDIITCNAHGLTANTPVQFTATVLPTGLVAATTYYVRDVTANTFKVSAAVDGGAAVNITSNGTNVNVQEVTALLLCAAGATPALPSTYVAKQKISTLRIEVSGGIDTSFRQAGKKVFVLGGVKTVTMSVADTWQALASLTYIPTAAMIIGGWMASKDIGANTGVGVASEVLPTGQASCVNYHNAEGASVGFTTENGGGGLNLTGAGSWEVPVAVTRQIQVKGANTTASNFYFQNTWYLLP
jgi:hypothetical protein